MFNITADWSSGSLIFKNRATGATIWTLGTATFPLGGVAADKKVVGGAYTVTADDDTAATKTIATGLTAVVAFNVMAIRSGKVVSSDPAVSMSSGNIVVADGSSYVLTAGDVIHWIAYGT